MKTGYKASPKRRKQARQQRNQQGRFVQTWHLQESAVAGGPAERLFLPPKMGDWTFRWYRKRNRLYVEADRGCLAGRRVRLLATTPEKAVEKAKKQEREIQEHGQYARALSTEHRWQMAHMLKLCEPLGVMPLEIVQEYVRKHPLGGNARHLDQVRRELVARKEKGNRRERYVRDFDYKLRKLIAAIGDKRVTDVTTDDFEQEIARHTQWGPRTIHGAVQTWKVLMNYCVKRGYRGDNPCDKIELPELDQKEPVIFTVPDVRRMMAATLFDDRDPLLPACQAYCAIGVFAGVRPEEMERLEWEQVDLGAGAITITGAKAKCRSRRIVDISPNLRTWIAPLARKRGPVLRQPIALLRAAIRKAMGLERWPADVLRHSFGSYHFGHHRNEALVKNQMGHTDDGRMFFSHYRVLVKPSEAAAFWQIVRPAGMLPAPRT